MNSLSDYEYDQKVLEYCKNNRTDSKCQCLLLDSLISLYSKSSYSSPYCWYTPCKNSDNYITSLIKAEQTYCNITICEISIGDIILNDNGNLRANNDCVSSINPIFAFSQRIINFSDIEIPNLIINFIYPLTVILTSLFLIP